MLVADEVIRCIGGAWDLLQRRQRGLRRFDLGPRALARSFWALALCAPVFVTFLAAARLRAGAPDAGGDLFDRIGPVRVAMVWLFVIWFVPPLVALPFARRQGLLGQYRGFLIVSNWSSVLACWFAAVPATLYALRLATPGLADLYAIAVVVLVAHLRWFTLRSALGFAALPAAGIVALNLAVQGAALSLAG